MSKKTFSSFSSLVYSTNPDAMKEEHQEELPSLLPHQQKLKIITDKKQRAGKIVTLIEGFKGNEKELIELAKKLKTKCGVGGSVKDNVILIQGDFKSKILFWFQEWGYNVK